MSHAYRVHMKIKNNRLWLALERTFGVGVPQAIMAKRLGMHVGELSMWLGMRRLPRCRQAMNGMHKDGEASCHYCTQGFHRTAWRVAKRLREDPDYLFDRELYGQAPRPLTLELDRPALEAAGLLALPAPSPDELVERHALTTAIDGALDLLTPREAEIVRLRFGLLDDEQHTFDEIARQQGVGPERIRQIQEKALRKLRHPSRVRALGAWRPFQRSGGARRHDAGDSARAGGPVETAADTSGPVESRL